MNAITADLAGLEGGGVALSSADLNRLSARGESPLLRNGVDDWHGSVVVWNGMVARIPALRRPTPADDPVDAIAHSSRGGPSSISPVW